MTKDEHKICKKCLIENWDKIKIGEATFMKEDGYLCPNFGCPYKLERLVAGANIDDDFKTADCAGVVLAKDDETYTVTVSIRPYPENTDENMKNDIEQNNKKYFYTYCNTIEMRAI